MQKIFPDLLWARTAFLLAALGSGFGWLQLIFNITSNEITPIDFWFIDSYVFFSLSIFPHFAFITAAMCISLILWRDYLKNLNKLNIVGIALIAISVQFTNPIAFATINASFLGATLFSWWNMRKIFGIHIAALSIIAIAQLPGLLYNVTVLNYDSLWSQYTSQHQTPSPPPDYYFWGFALFWPFAFWGAVIALRQRPPYSGAAIFWIFTGFLLAYAPLHTQRRFLQNITIPLAILTTQGLVHLFENESIQIPLLKIWKKSLVILFVFLVGLSSFELSLGRALYLQTYPENFFYPASLEQAAKWLRENAHYNDFVLASEDTSQILAQKAGVRVYFGHEMETLNYQTKQLKVKAFFQGKLPGLASSPIKGVVYGPFERQLSPSFQIPNNLELVYNVQDLQIYQVK